MMSRYKKAALWMLIIFIAFCGAIVSRWSILESVSAEESAHYKRIHTFAEALTLIKKNYVEEVEDKELVYGAIRGMLSSLDPHSSFMPPKIYKEMQVDTKGEFGGLGIQISIKDKVLTVISPIEDTPAYRLGVKAGDKIVKIDDESTKDMSLLDAVSKLRGPKGTSVTITIVRKGLDKLKDITIVRDIIKIKSVKSRVIDNDIGYVKLLQFQQKTASDLETALKNLEKEKIKSLILDLRNNPGGLLNSSVDVTSQFLPPGKLVVYIKGKDGEKTKFKTSNSKPHYEYQMIVLVNEGSASASEIVAGALQDWKRAVILGTQTFGKGSVQTIIPLTDGSGLRLTTARYYTPDDRSIQTTGIKPDIIVELEAKAGSKKHPIFREKDLEKHLENDTIKDTESETDEKKEEDLSEVPVDVSEKDDVQLQRAIDLLKTWEVFMDLQKAS